MSRKQAPDLPLVSVLVPSYNHAPYVRHTVESIVGQTYPNIELIVVDDGSRDSSPELLRELSRQYGFRLEVQENRGVPATRNRLISLARGTYLCGCGSDDYYLPEKVAKQVAFMEAHPEFGMCYGRVRDVNAAGDEVELPPQGYRQGWIFRDLFLKHFTIPALTHMVRREVFEAVGPYDEAIAVEDWFMWLRIAERYQIGFMDEELACYRRHGSNLSSSPALMVREHEKVIELYRDHPLYPEARRAWNLRAFRMLARSRKLQGIRYMMGSLSHAHRLEFWTALAVLAGRWGPARDRFNPRDGR